MISRVELQLQREDALSLDNQRWLRFDSAETIRALIVDGAPAPLAQLGEVYYLERALVAAARQGQPTPRAAHRYSGHYARALWLSAPGWRRLGCPSSWRMLAQLSPTQAAALGGFVEEGGGAHRDDGRWRRFRGHQPPPSAISCPASCAAASAWLTRTIPIWRSKRPRPSELDFSHPVLEGFALPGGESLRAARCSSYVLVEPSPQPHTQTLIHFSDGAPALPEKRRGKGVVYLWTTSVDADWCDLPLRKGYLPLMQSLVGYAGSQRRPEFLERVVGEGLLIEAAAGAMVQGPQLAKHLEKGAELRFEQPGNYHIVAAETQEEVGRQSRPRWRRPTPS